ncbi:MULTISPECIES: ATP-binding protein [Kitasatospora]|uniref:ATP-binding protein n=1 Tax=Kitasatospora cathayae TaxID=3004092 RepID=A0ABY7QEX4_9ACTN|nr:ATP-binding protein [Kitasatospora sp. HUAS 3-15]WBP91304.1 ATP-binding protein [Kitasatospora sp. HUAS 3-15]
MPASTAGVRELALDYRPGVVRVRVGDHNQAPPRPLALGRPGGYGFLAVERLTACWGVTTPDPGGKTVWVELLTIRQR